MNRSVNCESNILLLYLWRVFRAGFAFSIPMLTVWWQSQGMSLGETLWLQMFFALALALSEFPTGFIADQKGRKRSLLYSAVLLFAASALYVFVSSFNGFLVAEVLLGIGFALSSGADQALLHDTVLALGKGREHAKYHWHRMMQVELGANLVFMIVGGYLGSKVGVLPLIGTAVLLGGALIVALLLKEAPYQRTEGITKGSITTAITLLLRCFREKELRVVMILPALVGALNQPMAHLYTAYWIGQGQHAALSGALFASLNGMCLVAAMVTPRIEKALGLHLSVVLPLFVLGGSYVALGYQVGLFCLVPFMLQQVVRAFSRAVYALWVQERIVSDRATFGSVQSMLMWFFYAAVLLPLGGAVDALGIIAALWWMGLLVTLLSCSVVLVVHVQSKKNEGIAIEV